ncbi:hypothetical protein NUACC21_61700 [Scytonema sp. NUACC21]
MSNSKYNRNSQQKNHSEQENSGVSVNLRLPGRTIATALSVIVAFAGGMGFSGTQNHNVNQKNEVCTVINEH